MLFYAKVDYIEPVSKKLLIAKGSVFGTPDFLWLIGLGITKFYFYDEANSIRRMIIA